MFNDASFGYPVGGSGSIPKSFLGAFERLGGKIHFNSRASRIHVENAKVVGVETSLGYYQADTVISNSGIHRTIDMVGKEHFPSDYVTKSQQYTYSNSYVTIKYALDHQVVRYPVVFYMPHLSPESVFKYIRDKTVPEDPYLFMPIPSNHDPNLAPKSKQLVIAGTAAPPEASDELYNSILDKVHAKVCELFPDLESAIVWQSRSTSTEVDKLIGHHAGEAIGLAQNPQQVGKLRPELATPIAGLWLVGSDAGARGIGTEMAVGSALNLAEIIK